MKKILALILSFFSVTLSLQAETEVQYIQPEVARIQPNLISKHTARYKRRMSNAKLTRYSMGAAAVGLVGTGVYLTYKWFNKPSQDNSSTLVEESDVYKDLLKRVGELTEPEKQTLAMLEKEHEQKVLQARLDLLKKRSRLYDQSNDPKAVAKRNFILGLAGGISFGVVTSILSTFDPLKKAVYKTVADLWSRNAKKYFDFWNNNLVNTLEQLRSAIFFFVHKNRTEQSSLFNSHALQVISTHRALVTSVEHVLALSMLKPNSKTDRDIQFVVASLNELSDQIELSVVASSESEYAQPTEQLVPSFMHASDALMLFVQSNQPSEE